MNVLKMYSLIYFAKHYNHGLSSSSRSALSFSFDSIHCQTVTNSLSRVCSYAISSAVRIRKSYRLRLLARWADWWEEMRHSSVMQKFPALLFSPAKHDHAGSSWYDKVPISVKSSNSNSKSVYVSSPSLLLRQRVLSFVPPCWLHTFGTREHASSDSAVELAALQSVTRGSRDSTFAKTFSPSFWCSIWNLYYEKCSIHRSILVVWEDSDSAIAPAP